jgi:hypothetical protein
MTQSLQGADFRLYERVAIVASTGSSTNMTKIRLQFFLWSLCLVVLTHSHLYAAPRKAIGHIDVSAEKCSFDDAVYVYDAPDSRPQKPVGVLQDKAKVKISLNSRLRTYFLVDGNDADDKRMIGYVEKGCIVVDEEEAEEPPPPPTLVSGLITVYPLDLGEKYSVTIGEKTGTCTANSTKELSCEALPNFQAIIANQRGHEFLLGCEWDNYETCANLQVGTYRITVHGRSVTVWNSGMERINTSTGKKIGAITPVFSILTLVK